jgi:hypothetical protein
LKGWGRENARHLSIFFSLCKSNSVTVNKHTGSAFLNEYVRVTTAL